MQSQIQLYGLTPEELEIERKYMQLFLSTVALTMEKGLPVSVSLILEAMHRDNANMHPDSIVRRKARQIAGMTKGTKLLMELQ